MSDKPLSYQEAKIAFGQLETNHYWVLGILGIWGDSIHSRIVYRVIRETYLVTHRDDPFTQFLINDYTTDLEKKGWISRTSSTEYCILPIYKEAVARTLLINHPKQGELIIKRLIKLKDLPKYVRTVGTYYRETIFSSVMRLQYLEQDSYNFFNNYSSTLSNARWDEKWLQKIYDLTKIMLPYDPEWIDYLKTSLRTRTLSAVYFSADFYNVDHVRFQEQLLGSPSYFSKNNSILRILSTHLLLKQGEQLLPENLSPEYQSTSEWCGLQATWALLQNEKGKSNDLFEKSLQYANNSELPDNFFTCIYILFHFSQHEKITNSNIVRCLQHNTSRNFSFSFQAISILIHFLLGHEEDAITNFETLVEDYYIENEGLIVFLWCVHWMGLPLSVERLQTIESFLKESQSVNFNWLAGEITNILAQIHPQKEKKSIFKAQSAAIAEKFGVQQYIGDLFRPLESWERVLKSFERIALGSEVKEGATKRVVWFIDFDDETLVPKEQKKGKSGKWSSGRKISILKVLEDTVDSFSNQDRKVADAIESIYYNNLDIGPYRRHSAGDLRFNFSKAAYLLADHPYVYLNGRQHIPVEIIQAKPQLFITETDDGVELKMEPSSRNTQWLISKETPTRYKVYHFDEEQLNIARSVTNGMFIPENAVARLENVVDKLRNKITIHSTLELEDNELPKVLGATKPCLHLLPFGEGFKLQFTAKPIPSESYYFPMGEGIVKQILETKEGQVVCTRDLLGEQKEMQNVLDICPFLTERPSENNEWQIEEVQDCLQLLLELRPLREEGIITIEYPKGEKIKLIAVNGTNDLSLRIKKERDWFSMDGELQVDEDQVLTFQRLLEHIQNTESPFVEMKKGEFVALTDDFRQRLLELEGILLSKGKRMQLPTLAAPMVESFAGELAELEMDNAWADQLERMHKARKIRPRVPKSFKAELRPYQEDGFKWLMRLAEWGVGACLADDMGLGKTIQALALLTSKADKGPALVIAPASVTRNWYRETERFAPALKPHLLLSSKNTKWAYDLGPGDILLVSYGLLSFVEDLLTDIVFNTVVLDEAQAIKNRATKRSKIVMRLQADFRLATTGTPIENHLGELWNLFRFLNPGLLGSHKAFSDKFAKPILRDNDDLRREHLRRLIRPFILRRLKSEVLTELPPKTEVTLTVELTPEEMAFYESLRRKAIEEIESADGTKKRFTILAQMTRLRQAACHPRLVVPETRLGSSKLQLIGETVLELIENNHKVLIFSQFVRHLRIVEQWVKSENIAYQYLDGQTPTAKREVAINAFQKGEGELFLISLKAGGTGLNLTAADYVLHLDPWWNPAVEDQASDRAHRIGQQRPVTVYRFVAENTIEKKIVALHKEKRQLADQLLSGTGASAKLSMDDMLDLLRE